MAKLLSGSRIYGNAVVDATLTSGNLAANSNVASTSTTTGALRVTGGAGISGNLIAGGHGQFSGLFNENTTASGVFIGNTGSGTPSPRIGFFNGNTTQNWQIDNFGGVFRWFTPGVSRMELNSSGDLSITSTTTATSTSTGALIVSGGAGISGNVFAGNVLATGFFYANGTPFTSSSYGNATVATYIPTDPTFTGYLTFANANAATQATSLNTINANLGAYQTYANANVSNLYNSILGSNSAIVTANTAMKSYVDTSLSTLTNGASTALDTLLEIGTALGNNANFSGVMVTWLGNITANNTAANTNISTTQANLGAYQTFANANAASQATSINTINANIGAYQTFANANAASQTTAITSLATNANTNTAAYLSGAISTGALTVTGNVLPSANVTYDLGSPTQRWKDLYLSGNTLVLGQANIQAHSSGITIYAPNQTVNLNQNLHTTATPSFANITATGNLIVSARLRDYTGNAGLNGQLLVSTGTSVQWVTRDTGTLDSLTDVNLSSPQVQQVLTYDGTNWVNADSNAVVASAVFASSQSDLGYVTDLVLTITEDEGSVTDVTNNIYDLGVLSFTGIISLNNIDQSIKSDYLGYSIIFGF
jgi:hypothetical protein